jgi:hypothetical protein
MEQRLAVLMGAEVVGYSLLTGIDEQDSLAALGAVRRDMIDPKVDQHKSRILPRMGARAARAKGKAGGRPEKPNIGPGMSSAEPCA